MKKSVSITILIVALVLVCAGIMAVGWFSLRPIVLSGLQIAENRVSASTDEQKTVDVAKTTALKVEDDAGDVTITGADVDKITVDIHKTSWAASQSQAEQELKDIKYEIVQQGDTLVLRYKMPDQGIRFNGNPNTVDFKVTVPNEMEVTVDGGFGSVDVANIKGNANLQSNFGEITIQNLEGGLTVNTDSGTVTAKSITAGKDTIDIHSGFGRIKLDKGTAGNVKVDSQSGEIELIDVRATGDVEASTQFGDATFNGGTTRALTVNSSSGKVSLSSLNVNGTLTISSDFGEIELEKVKATSYDVTSQSGSVTINGAQGEIKVDASFGSINVTNAENATLDLQTQSGSVDFEGSLGDGPHTIHSDFGEISLTIPADSTLNVDLQTDFGSISSDIPVTMVLSGNVEQSHQAGTMNGGGPELNVSTQSGGITIKAMKE